MRRADLVGQVVGVAAAAGREGDDGRDVFRVLAGQRQRAPGAGGVPDDDHAVRPDKGLLAQHSLRLRRSHPRWRVRRAHNRLRRSRPGPPDSVRRWRRGRDVPAPARQSRAPPARPPARGIRAAAFARDAARSASRRVRSPPAETARRRAGETAARAPRRPWPATAPAIAACDPVRPPRLARPARPARARLGYRPRQPQPGRKTL